MPRTTLCWIFAVILLFAISKKASGQNAAARLEATYIGDGVANLAGGVRRDVVYLDNANLTLTLDAERLVGWHGGTVFFYGIGTQGGSPTGLVGDAQGVDNIEVPGTWKLYEAWVQQVLLDAHASLLVGLYDLNSGFDVIRTASLFINSSHGIGPDFSQSGRNGPSIFPTTSAGIRLKTLPLDNLYVQAALLDGVPGDLERPHTLVRFDEGDGLLLAAEVAYLVEAEEEPEVPLLSRRRRSRHRRISRIEDPPYDAKIALGAWTYTTDFDVLDTPGSTIPSQGVYALAEWDVYTEPADAEQGLSIFGRVGVADHRVNRFGSYTGVGGVYTGLVPGREGDQAGLAIAAAHNGASYKTMLRRQGEAVNASEINIEATYRVVVSEIFSVQADVQYVIHPDTNPALGNALVVLLRFEISI